VDHAQAIPLAERAVRDWPAHPGNRFLLALELLARAPDRRGEAIALLEATARLDPRDDHLVEDTAMRITAREEVERLGDARTTP
jgi:hypothetical protein